MDGTEHDELYRTAPPDEPPPSLKRRLVAKASAVLLPLVTRAARAYVGGIAVEDALCVARRLELEGYAATIGYWDRGHDSLADIRAVYLNSIEAMAATSGDRYLSVKPPALRYSEPVAKELAAAAAPSCIRIHCDSHGADMADPSNAMLAAMGDHLGADLLGTTLPGRWQRSLCDADWACARGFNVRVVKGQWPDPADPGRDIHLGFLEVIDRLAGRARHVSVATHDFGLGRDAISRLKAAGTSCDIEVLLGMPARPLLNWTKQNGIAVRVYVPYGAGFVPNAIGVLRRNPRLLPILVKGQFDQLVEKFVRRG